LAQSARYDAEFALRRFTEHLKRWLKLLDIDVPVVAELGVLPNDLFVGARCEVADGGFRVTLEATDAAMLVDWRLEQTALAMALTIHELQPVDAHNICDRDTQLRNRLTFAVMARVYGER